MLDAATAERFATLTLGHLTREWPYKLDQVLNGPADLALPATLHPIFHGSFDWHSCVHGWWQVMRLARLFPTMDQAAAIEALADRMLLPHRVAGEVAYLDRPMTGGFERPYGWGWLLALHDELALRPDRPWAAALEPLARAFAARFAAYLPKLLYPVRSGKHDSTAFALIHALRWARTHDAALVGVIEERSRLWFGADRAAHPWEPSGEDFLSATLCEAVLMQDVLGADFLAWLGAFLPQSLRRTDRLLAHAGRRHRSQRRSPRPSRRPEPRAGLVLAAPRRRSARANVGPPDRPRTPPSRAAPSRGRLYG